MLWHGRKRSASVPISLFRIYNFLHKQGQTGVSWALLQCFLYAVISGVYEYSRLQWWRQDFVPAWAHRDTPHKWTIITSKGARSTMVWVPPLGCCARRTAEDCWGWGCGMAGVAPSRKEGLRTSPSAWAPKSWPLLSSAGQFGREENDSIQFDSNIILIRFESIRWNCFLFVRFCLNPFALPYGFVNNGYNSVCCIYFCSTY